MVDGAEPEEHEEKYDPDTAVVHHYGMKKSATAYLAPRTDVRPEEQCFAVLNDKKRIVGNIQKFKDGSVAYWTNYRDKGNPAATVEDALARLFLSLHTSAGNFALKHGDVIATARDADGNVKLKP